MMGDYGYAEEGKLGKPYNLKLLKRLAQFARPYGKMVAAGLLPSILVALFDLSVPYLTKIAIDRYILATWYEVDGKIMSDPAYGDLEKRYAPLFEKSAASSASFISNLNLKKIDPADLHLLKGRDLLSSERFYRIGPGRDTARRALTKTADGVLRKCRTAPLWFPTNDWSACPKKSSSKSGPAM